MEFIGNWYNFDAKVDENIEKEFSDPNSSQIVVPVIVLVFLVIVIVFS